MEQGIINRVDPDSAARSDSAGDVELVLRASRGDRQAFGSLLETRLDKTFRLACAILGSEADARDVTQEAFTSAWVNLPRLRQPDRFDAWLSRVVVNRCRDALRRRRHRSREVPLQDVPPTGDYRDDPATYASGLDAAFGRLSVEQRQLLVEHHLFHRPLADIAEVLHVPVGTVKFRMHAARRALERALESDR